MGGGRWRWCGSILAWIYIHFLEMDSRWWRSSSSSWWRQWQRTCQGSRRWRLLFGVVMVSMEKDLPRLSPQSALKVDQWKMVATTHVSVSDWFEPWTWEMARSGLRLSMLGLGDWSGYVAQLAPLPHLDRSSDRCCQHGGFRHIVVMLCKVLVNNQ